MSADHDATASDVTASDAKPVDRIVIVGASLAGLRAAETLREEGFTGSLTLIGEERQEPYDRPPLSKQVLLGRTASEHTALPRRRALNAEWRLGVRATGLDLANKRVRLADGKEVGFDRLLIATGVRARPWPNPAQAGLDGVHVLRTSDDARLLVDELNGPTVTVTGHLPDERRVSLALSPPLRRHP
ncbi:MAG TPA: FAD-dependent oxidoreductase [Pseudonocardiaceae bacterium]|nr:FAD-dependent oxidoreductase [Pseudonocardiaceae bacterium]